MASHSRILAWRIPRDRGSQRATVRGVTKSQTRPKQLSTAHDHFVKGFNGINGQHVRTDGPGDSEMEILRKEQEEVPGHWCDPWSGKTPYASEELSLCPTVTEDCVPSPICSQ